MIRRTTLTLTLLAGCVWCLTLVACADDGPLAPGVFKPASDLHALMYGQVQHFKAVGKLVQDEKAPDRANRLALEAGVLAELSNVNIFHKDKTDYQTWARELRDASLELAVEAKKKKDADQSKLESLHKKIKNTCVACHDAYQ